MQPRGEEREARPRGRWVALTGHGQCLAWTVLAQTCSPLLVPRGPQILSNCVMVLGVDFFGIEMELFPLRRVTGGKWADNMIAKAPCSMLTPVMTCVISDITDRDDDTASGI